MAFSTLSSVNSLIKYNSGSSSTSNTLIYYMTFNSSGAVENQGVSISNDGTSTYVNDTNRKSGGKYVINFSGSSGIKYTNSITLTSSYTILYWLYNYTSGVMVGGYASGAIWFQYLNSGKFDCGATGGEIQTSSTYSTLAGSSWNHWAYVRDNTNLVGKIYQNGNLVSTTILTSYSNQTSFTGFSMEIGAGYGYGNYINSGARMDCIMLYSGALTQSQIQTIYTSQS
jgi:hypothetical protein